MRGRKRIKPVYIVLAHKDYTRYVSTQLYYPKYSTQDNTSHIARTFTNETKATNYRDYLIALGFNTTLRKV